MSVDTYLNQLRALAAEEPMLPRIAAKKPVEQPQPEEDQTEDEVDDTSTDEDADVGEDVSFDDFMSDSGYDDTDDTGETDEPEQDTDVGDDHNIDDLTLAEDEAPVKPHPAKPAAKPPAKKPAAKQPPPQVPQAAPVADMAQNIPQPSAAVSDMDAVVKAAQQERSNLEAKMQERQQSAPITGASVASMRGICESLAQASFKFALVNLQRDLLATMEDNGLINEAKKIAGIDPEKLTNLTAQFIPAGRLIPALYQLGWKPVHKTGINENYPKNERYELTMSNGVMFITVRGTYDWSVMQTSTVIRYATDAELRRYGLLREAEDTMMEAAASGKSARIMYVPSRMWYGATAAQYPALQQGVDVALCREEVFSPDGCNMRNGDNVALRTANNSLIPAQLHGMIQTSDMETPVAWCLVSDGYALVPLTQLMRGCL